MKLRLFRRKTRRVREEGLAQVRFHKHLLDQPGELGDIELNQQRAKALREQAQKEDG